MALTNFIPQLWAAGIRRTLDKTQVFGGPEVVNRDYEGEIREKGDTVKIQGFGDPTVSNYTRNTNIAAPEVLADNTRSLVIDQAKYANVAIDRLDVVQANTALMTRLLQRIAYQFRDAEDGFLASKYVDAGVTSGTDAAPVQITATNVYDTLVDLGVLLDEKNVPNEGRWAILPPWIVGMLEKSDEFQNLGGDNQIVRNGFVGRAAGFNILESNNVKTVVNGSSQTVYQVMAGTRDAITFAEQITEIVAYTPELRFGDAVKALIVYGAKTVEADALANLKARK